MSPAHEGMTRPAGATWNGAVVTSYQVREYTSLTTQVSPIPTLLLVVTYGTDCAIDTPSRLFINPYLDRY